MADEVNNEASKPQKLIFFATTIAVCLVNTGFLFFIFVSTLWGNIRGTIKKSEKMLLYNVIAPDVILTLFGLVVICPATYRQRWTYSEPTTIWLGFIFLWSFYHATMAMANICSLIALSYSHSSTYDATNASMKLFILCLSYCVVSCCLCSFPATEKNGFSYNNYWFHPTITIFEGYGGVFAVLSNTGLGVFIMVTSVKDLLRERQEYRLKKVAKKVQIDLDHNINFVGLCITMALFMPISLMIPFDNYSIIFVFRILLYAGPIFRVLLLTRTCPHFRFISSESDDHMMSEFANLRDSF